MAERGSYDIQLLLSEAQHRWLRPAEICEILRNHQTFRISSEPPNRPPSGSLFLFDRNVLRYFRKDGHNWRKKKDGKTVKEAHEKLKVGSVDVLHCYYAHGEDNEYFQRRSYWMLEEDKNIVFVHYLEVKGNRTNVGGIRETDDSSSSLREGSPQTSSSSTSQYKAPSGSIDYTSPSPNSCLTSLCEDADSGDIHQANSRLPSYAESPQLQFRDGPLMNNLDVGFSVHPSSNYCEGQSSIHVADYIPQFKEDRPNFTNPVVGSQNSLGLGTWEEILEQCSTGYNTVPSHVSVSPSQHAYMGVAREPENVIPGKLLAGETVKEELENSLPNCSTWQLSSGDNVSSQHKGLVEQSSNLDLPYDFSNILFEKNTSDSNLSTPYQFSTHHDQQIERRVQNSLVQFTNIEPQSSMPYKSDNNIYTDGNVNYNFALRQQLLDGEEGLKKVDSFSRWMSKALGDADLQLQSSSGIPWSTVECGGADDDSSLSPSISKDQLFTIINFSPKWAFTDSQPEVLVYGNFLKSQQEVEKYRWSCMFGEVEVPAEVLAHGILCCQAPPHRDGLVPFYVTCSNRLACSELREFNYKFGSTKDLEITDIYDGNTIVPDLHRRLEKLLSLGPVNPSSFSFKIVTEKHNLINKIISLKEEDESHQHVDQTNETGISQYEVKYHLLTKLMKEKLYSWLIRKATEDGKGPNILDDEGQGVLHLAAALGYDWAIKPIVTAGVSINFRDINGWTALHWAAFYGREETVAFLVSLKADPGLLTDPSPEFRDGRTPADLASDNGHKGISGFLAESSLTSQLSSLELGDLKEDGAIEISATKAIQTVSERTTTPRTYGEMPDALSLKDSLTAVRNATQAADRIHQMFRMQSLERRQLNEYGDDRLLDERALSLLAGKSSKAGPSDGQAFSAAVQIQKKYRGWKKRNEFLIIRQRIVKIQAHVRGHQVRKQYRAITWSVGILEKVILRWRRKGSGLRGFRSDAVNKESAMQSLPLKEDDYDFFKEGRKQTEERLQKALTRVKSMVQYPEGRAQYRRVLNVVEGLRETKTDLVMNESEETTYDDLIEIDKLLDDDTFMSIAFE
ncbi:calmodulin-binding transcription activator 1 isoform X2 [Humulus lupulus]|uniref:calmodulin-binding transcription activator 1 isoform X2 n=1 Tax=Humulus lupulus TaxID=3486 RepID=UPI002B40B7B8|nr:calmodulin-binding transcription activator 1 isoform X2 [Humulus lupulus]